MSLGFRCGVARGFLSGRSALKYKRENRNFLYRDPRFQTAIAMGLGCILGWPLGWPESTKAPFFLGFLLVNDASNCLVACSELTRPLRKGKNAFRMAISAVSGDSEAARWVGDQRPAQISKIHQI